MELISDPIVLSIFGKIVAGALILLLIIGFVPGVIVGWFLGRFSKDV